MKVSLSIFLLLIGISTIAQDAGLEQSLRQQFSEPDKVHWVKTFKGRLNDFNDILVVLAFDGYNCKGRMTYLRSKTSLQLEGIIQDNFLQIKELDGAGNVSGHLRGKIMGNIIEADWSNFDDTIAGKIILLESRKANDFPTHCGDNKWYSYYKGKDEKGAVELFLQKGGGNQMRGILFLNNQSFSIKGGINLQNELIAQFEKFEGDKLGELQADFKNQRNFKASIRQKNQAEKVINFKLEEQLSAACFEYADFLSSYDLVYPKTKNSAFNDWMRKRTEEWITSCREHTKNLKVNHLDSGSRASARAFGWCDIEYYSDRVISGFITYSTTWEDKKSIIFNFDLQSEKLLNENDLFKDHFDKSYFLKNFVKKAFVNHRLYGNDEFQNWIQNVAFSNFTIRKDGINFSTDFDLVYGRQSMTIPWTELKPYLREVKIAELGISQN